MSHKKSRFWTVALLLSLVILAAAYYVRMPGFRAWVDARTPVVNKLLGDYVREPVQVIEMKKEQDDLFGNSKSKPTPFPRPTISAPVRPAATPEPVVAAPVATPPPPLDLPALTADPAKWPKKVKLHQPVKFPAVLNGQVVGELVAPAGTEVELVSIKDGQVGVKYNGGGALVPADQTDVLARAQAH